MTKTQAEEIFTTCSSIVDVLGGDLRELCRKRGLEDQHTEEFIRKYAGKNSYDRFFKIHDATGNIELSEEDIVSKLKNFDIIAESDQRGRKVIRIPTNKTMNTVVLNLCKTLTTKYGYKYTVEGE